MYKFFLHAAAGHIFCGLADSMTVELSYAKVVPDDSKLPVGISDPTVYEIADAFNTGSANVSHWNGADEEQYELNAWLEYTMDSNDMESTTVVEAKRSTCTCTYM